MDFYIQDHPIIEYVSLETPFQHIDIYILSHTHHVQTNKGVAAIREKHS